MMREVPVRDTDPDPYTLSRDMQVIQNNFGWLDTLALARHGQFYKCSEKQCRYL